MPEDKPDDHINLPHLYITGEWEVLATTKDGWPRKAIDRTTGLGVAVSDPVTGPNHTRHPIRRIAVVTNGDGYTLVAWFDRLKNAQKRISSSGATDLTVTEDEWEERFDELWDDLHDANQVVFIEPEQPYESHRYLGVTGSYAGVLQADTNYDNLISRWRLDGFVTLHERVESVIWCLKAAQLQEVFSRLEGDELQRTLQKNGVRPVIKHRELSSLDAANSAKFDDDMYYTRSVAESVIHPLKRRFGATLRVRTRFGQVREPAHKAAVKNIESTLSG